MNNIYTNLFTVLNIANDEHFDAGINWYNDAREFCKMLSIESNLPYVTCCGVLAALSPRNKWERNKKDAYALCMNDLSHKYGTFHANVRKAKLIMTLTNKQDIINALNGKKIIAFFDNIFDENSERVTVDVHMLLAAMGSKLMEDERPNLTQSLYNEIEDALLIIASKTNLRPYEAQAVIWLAWRELA